MAAFEITVETRAAKRALDQLPSKTVEAVSEALYLLGEAAMALSKAEAPVRTGYLRSTGYVDAPRFNGLSVEVMLGYSASYSFYVHESHPSKAKFLERPLMQVIGEAEVRIRRLLAAKLKQA